MKSIRGAEKELSAKLMRVAHWERSRGVSDDELLIDYADEELWNNEGVVFE